MGGPRAPSALGLVALFAGCSASGSDARSTALPFGPVTTDPLMWFQVNELVALDSAAGDGFGSAVSVSGGTTLVGAPGKTVSKVSGAGAAYLFAQDGGGWSQAQELLPPAAAGAAEFGGAVAVTSDTVLVAAALATVGANANQGAVYAFAQSGSAWSDQQQLIASDGMAGSQLGLSLSVSGDVAVVGAGEGAAYVFSRSGSSWSQVQKLAAAGTDPSFGASVALSGGTVMVGAPQQTFGSHPKEYGAVFVFELTGGSWSQQQVLSASPREPRAKFGASVATSGSTALIGASAKPSGPQLATTGGGYVFARSGSGWSQRQIIDNTAPADANMGASVSLSGDAAVFGADNLTLGGPGAAFVFAATGASWSQMQLVTPVPGTTQAQFGRSVSLTSSVLVMGAPGALTGPGQVASGAAFLAMPLSSLGASCTSAASCGSGFCVDGVCCATECSGQCEACDGASVGTCAPLTGAPHAGKPACAGAGTPCAGSCDGTTATACTQFQAGGPCGNTCSDGLETDSTCDGQGHCTAGAPRSCQNLVCESASTCKATCASAADCASGFACSGGQCLPSSAVCVDPHTSMSEAVGGDAGLTDCAPYVCAQATGECASACHSVDDCLAPSVCDPAGRCVPAPPLAASSGACDVSAGPRGRQGSLRLALVACALALARRRRGRGAPRRPRWA